MLSSKIFEILSSYNPFWVTGNIEAGIPRDAIRSCLEQLHSKEVVVLKGVRRCGKSTLLAQVIRHLLSKNTKPTSILLVNLEEPLFAPEYSVDLLEQIYRTYREQVEPEGKCWLFLDEIQNIPKWESWVRGRLETENIKIFLTGSSATMLSREIGTRLTGRQVSLEVFPLSFREFLQFRDISVTTPLEYVHNKNIIRNAFLEYIKYGGFPEIVLKKGARDKELLLKNYFEDILYRDIAARHQVRDVTNLRNLAVYLFTNMAKTTSINKLKNNFSISQDKTENYVSAILESYLLFELKKFSFSLKSTLRAGFKPYAIDTGLRNRVSFSFSEDTGWIVENIIFLHLRQRHEEIFYTSNGSETDFVVKEGINMTQKIQVWYADVHDRIIPDRELNAFTNSSINHTEDILITNDLEETIETGSIRIRCIPATKYLLLNETLSSAISSEADVRKNSHTDRPGGHCIKIAGEKQQV